MKDRGCVNACTRVVGTSCPKSDLCVCVRERERERDSVCVCVCVCVCECMHSSSTYMSRLLPVDVALCCSVLQRVAVCCSVLQCAAVCSIVYAQLYVSINMGYD